MTAQQDIQFVPVNPHGGDDFNVYYQGEFVGSFYVHASADPKRNKKQGFFKHRNGASALLPNQVEPIRRFLEKQGSDHEYATECEQHNQASGV